MKKLFVALIGLAFLFGNSAYGENLSVAKDGTGDYSTIQDAVDAAGDGDTIFIGPGTYVENVNITTNNLILKGSGINHSIIECTSYQEDCIYVYLESESTELTIEIEGLTIRANRAGIVMYSESKVVNSIIRNCEIIGNHSGICFGGDIQGNSIIENNFISCPVNEGFNYALQAAIWLAQGTYYIKNNTIVNSGMGIWCAVTDYSGSIVFQNNIIASNREYGIYKSPSYKTQISYNNAYNNVFGDYVVTDGLYYHSFEPSPGIGEISENPDFIGGGNYHLNRTSPCIDTGICTDVIADIDGDERPIGADCDMGADEYSGPIEIDINFFRIPKWRPLIINLASNRLIAVSILSTESFDAEEVIPRSCQLAGASARDSMIVDVDNDGDMDMLIYFNTRDLNLNKDATEVTFEGVTSEGMKIVGLMQVNVVPRGNAYAYGKTKK